MTGNIETLAIYINQTNAWLDFGKIGDDNWLLIN